MNIQRNTLTRKIISGDKKYYVCRHIELAWNEAKQLCESYGMRFASFDSSSDSSTFSIRAGDEVWVGLYRLSGSTVTGDYGAGIKWGSGEPSGPNNCIRTKEDGFGNYNCENHYKIGCILEKKWWM